MKRMHALPIELPLVASGEYQYGSIVLDNPLPENSSLLVVIEIIVDEISLDKTISYLNTFSKNDSVTSTIFTMREYPTGYLEYTYRYGNAKKINVLGIGNHTEGSLNYSYLAYIYKLPFSITLP